MKKIYLIRHGETEANKKGIFRGRLDLPLSERGKTQAKELKNYFKDKKIEFVFSSPLIRAYETAKIAFDGLTIEKEELLNNIDLGEWSGKEKSYIKEKEPRLWQMWTTKPEKMVFPGGESLENVYERVYRLKEKLKKMDFESIALISHRSVLKVFFAVILDLKKNYFWKFHIDNCSVSIVVYDENRGFTITKLNDTNHLTSTVTEWF